MIALGLSAVVSAIAGALAAPLIGLVSPELVGIVLSTQVLIWVAIGGRNSMLGPFVGAVTLTLGANLLSDVTLNYYVLALGVVFVLVVIVAPEGLLGWFKRREVTPFSSAEQAPVDAHGHSDGDGPVLRARGVVKRFGNSVVVDGVDLDVARGEIVCLIGPNGAGKSTFLNVVSGALPLNAGSVQLMGVDCTDRPPHDRCSKGLGRTFQVPELFSELSVGEHFDLAHQESATNAHALPDRYRRVEQELGTSLTTELSLGDRRNLEIAMTLARGPRLLLLDEPAAGLSHDQSLELATTLRSARDATGCAMIVVEHDLDIVRALADRVAVLHQGRILCEGTMDEIEQHAIVRSAYLGAV
jgi:branched-chain amino acid transport system permease protein